MFESENSQSTANFVKTTLRLNDLGEIGFDTIIADSTM